MCGVMCKLRRMAKNFTSGLGPIQQALVGGGERMKTADNYNSLEECVARRSQKRVLDLMDRLEWDQSYDYKSERSRD